MNIATGHVVSFHYTIQSESGVLIDSSFGKSPFSYLHGYQDLNVRGLEEKLAGHSTGEEIYMQLSPSQMFGEHDPQKVQTFPRDLFSSAMTFVEGKRYTTRTPEGKELAFRIVKIQPDTIMLDFNHPLAGQGAVLHATVNSVREATPEEIADEKL